jgi:hypothetical protein
VVFEMEELDLVMVIHGPEPFDRGDVKHIKERIRPDNVIVAGVMGRTAAEESKIHHEFWGEPPSVVLNRLAKTAQVFLVNHGKTPQSGKIFGEIVAGRINDSGLVQVECSNNTIYLWNDGDMALAEDLSKRIGYHVERVTSVSSTPQNIRMIRGCKVGEAVFMNGIVIGTATGDKVTIKDDAGIIRAISGIEIKPHGMEKLKKQGNINISNAWCKSGQIRMKKPNQATQCTQWGRIIVADHAGHELYQQVEKGICGVLSIGDDTTAVCGHICSHLGIPIFGVTDGDADGIIPPAFAPGSVVVEVLYGRDDDIGAEIAINLDCSPRFWDAWVKETLTKLEGKVRITVKTTGDPDAMC